MRSSSRSLIASLGFADPDKRERTRDYACQYLGQGAVAPRLLGEHPFEHLGRDLHPKNLEWVDRRYEVYFARENSRSLTTIGFLDLVIEFGIHYYGRDGYETVASYLVMVEVKIRPVPVGDILRQMSFYQVQMNHGDVNTRWHRSIVATAFDLGPRDVEALYTKGIQHIRLHSEFRQYCEEREREISGPPASPEF